MPDQTPVQIAWVTRDLDATEKALTTLLGAKKWIRMPVVQQGVMPGGMRFAYVSAEQAGVPYIEIAYIPPEIRAFFDYVKQEQE